MFEKLSKAAEVFCLQICGAAIIASLHFEELDIATRIFAVALSAIALVCVCVSCTKEKYAKLALPSTISYIVAVIIAAIQ